MKVDFVVAADEPDFGAESEAVRQKVWERIRHELDVEELSLVAGALHHHACFVPEPLATRYRGIAAKIERRIASLVATVGSGDQE